MYKLIAVDLDDTLLNDQLDITEGTRSAIYAAMERGAVFTIATGRMFASARKIAAKLGLEVPLITYQGALVKHASDGTVIYERNVPPEVVRYVFEYAAKNGLHLQAYHNDTLLAKEENERLKGYAKLNNIAYEIEPDFDRLAEKTAPKLLMIDEPEVLDRVLVELKAAVGDKAHITKSKPHFLEIMHPEGTKGHALTRLAEHYGIKQEETIGIGDSWNDHELVEQAGLGVAMENAVDSLKQVADYVTRSNNDEGVRHVIEKFVLEDQN
ncbi:Cof-type HAD-IIB family hydrolase [Paenibacillus mesotrionivorans]|uniref:Cof-type HAD-IIB family hydrolase n=1 Tax=Paenibacillus mesotrionivorans TaxID=3160968 RepID=A0ACC7P346_9BACL